MPAMQGFPGWGEMPDWRDDPVQVAEYERASRASAEFDWDSLSQPDPYPDAVIDYGHPLIRCQYCGGYDTSLTTCPHCSGPRHWR